MIKFDKKIIILITVCLGILIALALIYNYFSIQFQKNKEMDVIKARQDVVTKQQQVLNNCIVKADNEFPQNFNFAYEINKSNFEKTVGVTIVKSPTYGGIISAPGLYTKDGPLPKNLTDLFQTTVINPALGSAEQLIKEAKDECYKLYK